ncbi:hypothetical protein K144316041_p21260 (plasmid) [Clostridium tetani]|uniref:hypothetical protein n=1 Tax=Clostridium tetani TaxID=1513 RepID=UPI002955BF01|nr:hypothetical protein [Clostridium tetani]BDR74287.1 hypothetical protein K144316041_p21260 [Clostridium tetani]
MDKMSVLKAMKPLLGYLCISNCPSHCNLKNNYRLCRKQDKCEECWEQALVEYLENIKE